MKRRAAAILAALAAAGCVADNTAEPPGDLHRFDAVDAYKDVAAFAGPGAELVEMHIRFARSDGTIDVEADYKPTVTYDFLRPPVKTAAEEKLPVGARGKDGDLEKVEVTIRAPGMWRVSDGRSSRDERHLGMDRHVHGRGHKKDKVVPPPTCDLARFWKEAIAAGAPKDAVADIKYDDDGWKLTIADVDFKLERSGADCKAAAPPP